jgi:hypothetical protein
MSSPHYSRHRGTLYPCTHLLHAPCELQMCYDLDTPAGYNCAVIAFCVACAIQALRSQPSWHRQRLVWSWLYLYPIVASTMLFLALFEPLKASTCRMPCLTIACVPELSCQPKRA